MESDLLKSAQWKQTQDGLATAMGLSLISYGPSRRVDLRHSLCEPSRENPICRLLQDQYGQRAQCEAHCGQQVARAFATWPSA